MRMFNPHFVLISAVGLLSAASCTLITDVDRQKIEPPETGSGGSAGSAGKGGSGGTTGGSNGEAGAGAGEGGTGTGGSSGDTNGGAGEAGAAGSSGSGGSSGGGTGGSGAGEAGSGGAGGVVPVCTKATGTISLDTAPNNTFFVDGDRFTVSDGINPAVTFEFDCGAGVVCNPPGSAAGVGAGREPIVFDGTEDEAGIAALIVTAVNGAGLRLTATLETSDGGGGGAGGEGGSAPAPIPGEPVVIELANELFGDRGNVRITERVANGNFTVSGLSGGEAVSCPAAVTACSDGDACESGDCDTSTNLCE